MLRYVVYCRLTIDAFHFSLLRRVLLKKKVLALRIFTLSNLHETELHPQIHHSNEVNLELEMLQRS